MLAVPQTLLESTNALFHFVKHDIHGREQVVAMLACDERRRAVGVDDHFRHVLAIVVVEHEIDGAHAVVVAGKPLRFLLAILAYRITYAHVPTGDGHTHRHLQEADDPRAVAGWTGGQIIRDQLYEGVAGPSRERGRGRDKP